jgi:hypothetical protein
MKFFIDTEFIERGREYPLTLISIGIVAQSGAEFYAVSSEYDYKDASDWVQRNVLPYVGSSNVNTVPGIAEMVLDWISDETRLHPSMGVKPEFWGYYADYDWVVFCQMFGTMMDLPKGWPMYCRDLKQLCDDLGNPELPKQGLTEHNALADARWNQQVYNFLRQ